LTLLRIIATPVVVALLVGYLRFAFETSASNPLVWLPSLAAGGLYFAAIPRIYRQEIRRRTKRAVRDGRYAGFIGKHTMRLGVDGIHVTMPLGETKWNWSAITSIEQGKDHLFLFLSQQLAIVAPKRAFTDEAEMREFLALVERYRTGASATPLPVAAGGSRNPWWHSRYGVESEAPDINMNRRG
jgi:hypothetical protein